MNNLSSETLYNIIKKQHFVIAGPCVLETYDMALSIAKNLKESANKLGLFPIFKSSFDKANRTSSKGFRGPGIKEGLDWLYAIKKEVNIPVLTDIHEAEQASYVGNYVDILQIPAFLCRQTSLLEAAAKTGKIVNVKKGQFLAPKDMYYVVEKLRSFNNEYIMVTERGTSFGYNNLIVDMRSFPLMKSLGVPLVIDATHSVQLPGGLNGSSGGEREFVSVIAKSAVCAGADGVFLECHPNPEVALCDGPNSIYLKDLPNLLCSLSRLWEIE